LGAIGPKAYSHIVRLLEATNPLVHKDAEIALAACDDRRAIPMLIGLCAGKDDTLRLLAAEALGRWSDPAGIEALTKLLHSGGNAAGSAASSLAQIGGKALDPLFTAAKDPDKNLRYLVAYSFMNIRDRRAEPKLVEALKSDDPQVRQQAFFALGCWADDRALPAILRQSSNPDMEMRRLAIGLLGYYDDVRHPEIVPPLLTAMTDPHEWVRSQAAGALFGKRDLRIEPAMKRLLNSPLKDVPPLAQAVLDHLPHRAAE